MISWFVLINWFVLILNHSLTKFIYHFFPLFDLLLKVIFNIVLCEMLYQRTFWWQINYSKVKCFGQEVLLLLLAEGLDLLGCSEGLGIFLILAIIAVIFRLTDCASGAEGWELILATLVQIVLAAEMNHSRIFIIKSHILHRPLHRAISCLRLRRSLQSRYRIESTYRSHTRRRFLRQRIRLVEQRPIAFVLVHLLPLFLCFCIDKSLFRWYTKIRYHCQQHDLSEAIFCYIIILTFDQGQFWHRTGIIGRKHLKLLLLWFEKAFLIEDHLRFQIIILRYLGQSSVMNLYFLCSHEHDIANIEQIYPVESVPLSFMTRILRHTELIPLCLSVQIEILLHPLYFIDWVERHFQWFDLLRSYVHKLIGYPLDWIWTHYWLCMIHLFLVVYQ